VSTTLPDMTTLDADRYLKEVAPYLASLSVDERTELLDDLAQHLREIAAEPGPPLAERLGSPQAYAVELLASAGVAASDGRRRPLRTRAVAAMTRMRATRVGREVIRLWPVLVPAWWVVRAYLTVSLVAALEGHGSYRGSLLPRLAGDPVLGLIGVVLAIPLSVRLGQKNLSRTGRLVAIAANATLAIYALVLLGRVATPDVRYVEVGNGAPSAASDGCLATASGQHITNLYAYGPDGTLLDPVLLYDQNGHAVDNLCPDYDAQGRPLTTQYSRDANGAAVINAFPRRQSVLIQPDPQASPLGSPVQPAVAVPVKPPAVVVPRLAPTPTTTVVPAAG
jgi:hypothetical protein